jgi:hypothetical protein
VLEENKDQFNYSTSPLYMGGHSGCVKDSRLKIRCADNIRMGLPKIRWGCGLIWLSIGTGSGLYKHDNEPSVYIKCWEVLDQMRQY